MKIPNINMSPALKISIGLVSLLAGWAMLVQMFIGFWPDQTLVQRELRIQTSENLATQSAVYLQSEDTATLETIFKNAIQRNPTINSIALRKQQGQIAVQTTDHQQYWKPISDTESTINFIRTGINVGHQRWGSLELAFKPASPTTFLGWVKQPHILALLLLAVGALLFFSLYLRKTFVHLDPSSVIPDRVSLAFDSFSEGVMMVDRSGRVVLANKVLKNWTGDNEIFGKLGKDIPWLNQTLRDQTQSFPWLKSMESEEAINGINIEFEKDDGEINKVLLNCSPILDPNNKVRGCIVTFDNVTELDRLNNELTLTMEELYKSQNEIEIQNTELLKLATRDPLTNCLNRRAFYEEAGKVFKNSVRNNKQLSCIMTDIDHFKRFNDQFGHAIGDKVIIAFSRTLNRSLRIDDLLTRYGGEEFCILLPDSSLDTATKIAERMRSEVELNAGQSIRSTEALEVTSSFGIAFLSEQVTDLSMLIDHADKALYQAKESGRNCVRIWDESLEEA